MRNRNNDQKRRREFKTDGEKDACLPKRRLLSRGRFYCGNKSKSQQLMLLREQ